MASAIMGDAKFEVSSKASQEMSPRLRRMSLSE